MLHPLQAGTPRSSARGTCAELARPAWRKAVQLTSWRGARKGNIGVAPSRRCAIDSFEAPSVVAGGRGGRFRRRFDTDSIGCLELGLTGDVARMLQGHVLTTTVVVAHSGFGGLPERIGQQAGLAASGHDL